MAGAGLQIPQDTFHKLGIIARLSIVLGICLQLVTLLTKLLGGMEFPGFSVLLDFTGSIVWSLVVCLGIGIGTIVLRSGAVLAGLSGILFAPVGLFAAKAAQKSVGLLLGLPHDGVTGTVIMLGAIKALEYGVLGAGLASLMKRENDNLKHYLLLGLATGIVFAFLLIIASQQLASAAGKFLTFAQIAGQGVNEVLFPICCALVIYTAQFMGRRIGPGKGFAEKA